MKFCFLVSAIALAVLFVFEAQLALAAPSIYHLVDLGTFSANSGNSSGEVVGYDFISGHSHAMFYSGGFLKDLGTLGGTRSEAEAINSSGLVVGNAWQNADVAKHAFLYSTGVMQDLGTLGGDNSAAHGVNDLGQIVGSSQTT